MSSKRAFGDWQTPLPLAREVAVLVARHAGAVASVVEPTCGEGSFLLAAADQYPAARLLGFELSDAYAARARDVLPAPRTRIEQADFFSTDWNRQLQTYPGPLLVLGNPPWVTSSTQGVLGSGNLPQKHNWKGLRGLDAKTGKSNFDVSEWMILRLLDALAQRDATVAMLCKASVARKVAELVAGSHVRPVGLWRIDAMRHFHAAVDAVLLLCQTRARPSAQASGAADWPVYAALDAPEPASVFAVRDGHSIADLRAHERTAYLEGTGGPQWRSGIKHDCANVMELRLAADGGGLVNGLGEQVDVEPELLFPLLKSSDVAHGVSTSRRWLLVTQRALGQDTSTLRESAPRAWRYLQAHSQAFAARKSTIYRGQPAYAIFGVGAYSFAPWKVAISGLYKRTAFTLLGPQHGMPSVLDDTCYFLPFDDESAARAACTLLNSPLAREFFEARVFWDEKRPINKALLQQLDLAALARAVQRLPAPRTLHATVASGTLPRP